MMTDEELRLLDTRAKLFDAVLRLWAHQDAYVWSRARLIVAVQGAILAAAYTIQDERPYLAALVLGSGAVLTVILLWMVRADERTRDSYYNYLDPLTSTLFAPPLYAQELAWRVIPEPSRAEGAPFRAGTLLRTAFMGLITVDLIYLGFMLGFASH